MLTKEMLAEWRQNPTTREVFKRLRTMINEIEGELGAGRTLVHSSAEETLAHTARAVGRIAGINELLEFGIFDEGAT
uniref:Uncharacterized protein n=1 Tax=viral metagenome TaxID=1070528 RepID=A0A6M3JYI6_9ZZZZ